MADDIQKKISLVVEVVERGLDGIEKISSHLKAITEATGLTAKESDKATRAAHAESRAMTDVAEEAAQAAESTQDLAKATEDLTAATKKVTQSAKAEEKALDAVANDAARADAAVDKLSTATATNTQKTKDAAISHQTLDDRLKGMNTSLNEVVIGFGALGGAIAAVATGFVSSAASFEKEMSRVKAVSQATSGEFERLKETAERLGAESSFDATQAASGLYELSAAGLAVNDAIAALPPTIHLAEAGNLGLAESAKITTGVMSGMRIPVENLSHAADVLTQTSLKANTSIQETGEAFGYAGSIMASTGHSIEDVAELVAVLANNSIRGSRAGTSLAGGIRELLKPTEDAIATLDRLGVSILDDEGHTKKLNVVLDELRAVGAGAGDMIRIFGAEAGRDLIPVLQTSTSEVAKLRGALLSVDGVTERVAKTQMDNFSGALERLGGSFDGLKQAMAGPFLTVLAAAADGMAGLVDALKDGYEYLGPVGTGLTAITTAVGVTAAAVAAMTGVWSFMLRPVLTLARAMPAVSGGIAATGSAAGAASGSVTILGHAFTGAAGAAIRFSGIMAGMVAMEKVAEFVGTWVEAQEAVSVTEKLITDAEKEWDRLVETNKEGAQALEEYTKGNRSLAAERERMLALNDKELEQNQDMLRARVRLLESQISKINLNEANPINRFLTAIGVSSDDSAQRIQALRGELGQLHQILGDGARMMEERNAGAAAGVQAQVDAEARLAGERVLRYQESQSLIEQETNDRLSALQRQMDAELISARDGEMQKISIALDGNLQQIAIANQRLTDMAAIGRQQTDDYRLAEEERDKLAKQFSDNKLKMTQDLQSQMASALDDSLNKERQLAQELQNITTNKNNAMAQAEEVMFQIRLRHANEGQRQAMIEEEFARRMDAAKKALTQGDATRALQAAQSASSIAQSMGAEQAALDGVSAASDLVKKAYEAQEKKARDALKRQQDESVKLRNGIKSVVDAVDRLVKTLIGKFKLQVDTKSAEDGAKKVSDGLKSAKKAAEGGIKVRMEADTKAAQEKVNQLVKEQTKPVKAELNTTKADAKILTLIQPASKTLNVNPNTARADAAINRLRQPTSSNHTVFVNRVYLNRDGGPISPIARLAEGGMPDAFVPRSGLIPGYDPARVDKVPALLTLGEYVLNALSVARIEALIPGFLNRLNAIRTSVDLSRFLASLSGFGTSLATARLKGFRGGGLVEHQQSIQRLRDGGMVAPAPAAVAGGGGMVFNFAPVFNVQGGDPRDMRRVFHDEILPALREALTDNASGIASAIRQAAGGR